MIAAFAVRLLAALAILSLLFRHHENLGPIEVGMMLTGVFALVASSLRVRPWASLDRKPGTSGSTLTDLRRQ